MLIIESKVLSKEFSYLIWSYQSKLHSSILGDRERKLRQSLTAHNYLFCYTVFPLINSGSQISAAPLTLSPEEPSPSNKYRTLKCVTYYKSDHNLTINRLKRILEQVYKQWKNGKNYSSSGIYKIRYHCDLQREDHKVLEFHMKNFSYF